MFVRTLTLLFLIVSYSASAQQKLFQSSYYTKNLEEKWELEKEFSNPTFRLTPFKPIYLSPGRWSSNPNEQPKSETPGYTLPLIVPYNDYEAKLQISFKTKVTAGLFKGKGDLWIGYTQRSHWQVYNKLLSRPFRETNYEPELILNFATKFQLAGFTGRMIGLSFNHQSNGRSMPLSRSWNRIIFHAGFEKDNWQVMIRPWIRIPDSEDENPEILNYTGRAEAIVIYSWKGQQFSTQLNHSLRLGDRNRGRIQFDWVFPVMSYLKGHLQVSEGYGETMIDYNHRQTTIGLGVSLVEW